MDTSALPISGIMRTKLITTRPDAPVEDVVDLLRIKHVGCVPVIDEAGRPIGIITKLDVLETLGENRRTARELMMPFARGIESTGTIADAASLMSAERIHHVLVLDDNRTLVGLVSSLDLADWIAKQGSYRSFVAFDGASGRINARTVRGSRRRRSRRTPRR